MIITLNNRKEDIPDKEQMSVQELLEYKNYTFKFLAVRVNGNPVKNDAFSRTEIKGGDKVQIWHLISGG